MGPGKHFITIPIRIKDKKTFFVKNSMQGGQNCLRLQENLNYFNVVLFVKKISCKLR